MMSCSLVMALSLADELGSSLDNDLQTLSPTDDFRYENEDEIMVEGDEEEEGELRINLPS